MGGLEYGKKGSYLCPLYQLKGNMTHNGVKYGSYKREFYLSSLCLDKIPKSRTCGLCNNQSLGKGVGEVEDMRL